MALFRTPSEKEPISLKTIYNLLQALDARIAAIEDIFFDEDGEQKPILPNNAEMQELRGEIKANNHFMQTLILSLVEGKKTAAPLSAAQILEAKKAEAKAKEEADAEIRKQKIAEAKQNGKVPLP